MDPHWTFPHFPGRDFAGGSWNEDDVIVFAPFPLEGLRQVSANGGEATLVTKINAAAGEIAHTFPRLLPGSRRFLFRSTGKGRGEICASSLDTPERHCIAQSMSFDYASSGVLLFLKGSEMLAQALDPASLTVRAFLSCYRPVSYGGGWRHSQWVAMFWQSVQQNNLSSSLPGMTLTAAGWAYSAPPFESILSNCHRTDVASPYRVLGVGFTASLGSTVTGDVLLIIDTARVVTSRLTGREFDGVDDPMSSPDNRQSPSPPTVVTGHCSR